MHPYVALLRGINVGGKNVIPMATLKQWFEAMGFANVRTYIQSGNVLFEAKSADVEAVAQTVEAGLAVHHTQAIPVVVVTAAMLTKIVTEAPSGFGNTPSKYRYDVIFLRPPVTPHQALPDVATNEGVDTVHVGTHALYFSRLISRASQSKLSTIVGKPIYKHMTIRNWNTTTRLLALLST